MRKEVIECQSKMKTNILNVSILSSTESEKCRIEFEAFI